MPIAKQDLWLSADRTEILTEEPDKGFTLAVEGAFLSPMDIKQYEIPADYYDEGGSGNAVSKQVVFGRDNSDDLPDDFPGYNALAEADITTYSGVRGVEDLTTIDGIGPATAEKIKEALG